MAVITIIMASEVFLRGRRLPKNKEKGRRRRREEEEEGLGLYVGHEST